MKVNNNMRSGSTKMEKQKHRGQLGPSQTRARHCIYSTWTLAVMQMRQPRLDLANTLMKLH